MVTDGTNDINMDCSETVPDVGEWMCLKLGCVVDFAHGSNKDFFFHKKQWNSSLIVNKDKFVVFWIVRHLDNWRI